MSKELTFKYEDGWGGTQTISLFDVEPKDVELLRYHNGHGAYKWYCTVRGKKYDLGFAGHNHGENEFAKRSKEATQATVDSIKHQLESERLASKQASPSDSLSRMEKE